MSIPKFVTFTSGAVPVEVENIDTDQIPPARFLKATDRTGSGDTLSATGATTPRGSGSLRSL